MRSFRKEEKKAEAFGTTFYWQEDLLPGNCNVRGHFLDRMYDATVVASCLRNGLVDHPALQSRRLR